MNMESQSFQEDAEVSVIEIHETSLIYDGNQRNDMMNNESGINFSLSASNNEIITSNNVLTITPSNIDLEIKDFIYSQEYDNIEYIFITNQIQQRKTYLNNIQNKLRNIEKLVFQGENNSRIYCENLIDLKKCYERNLERGDALLACLDDYLERLSKIDDKKLYDEIVSKCSIIQQEKDNWQKNLTSLKFEIKNIENKKNEYCEKVIFLKLENKNLQNQNFQVFIDEVNQAKLSAATELEQVKKKRLIQEEYLKNVQQLEAEKAFIKKLEIEELQYFKNQLNSLCKSQHDLQSLKNNWQNIFANTVLNSAEQEVKISRIRNEKINLQAKLDCNEIELSSFSVINAGEYETRNDLFIQNKNKLTNELQSLNEIYIADVGKKSSIIIDVEECNNNIEDLRKQILNFEVTNNIKNDSIRSLKENINILGHSCETRGLEIGKEQSLIKSILAKEESYNSSLAEEKIKELKTNLSLKMSTENVYIQTECNINVKIKNWQEEKILKQKELEGLKKIKRDDRSKLLILNRQCSNVKHEYINLKEEFNRIKENQNRRATDSMKSILKSPAKSAPNTPIKKVKFEGIPSYESSDTQSTEDQTLKNIAQQPPSSQDGENIGFVVPGRLRKRSLD